MRSTTSPRPTCTRSCTRSTRRSRRRGRRSPTGTRSAGSRSEFSRAGRAPPRRPPRPRRGAAAARHARTRSPSRWARCATGAPASASRCRGSTMPKLIVVERDYPHVAEQLGGARAAGRGARHARSRAPRWKPIEEVEWLRAQNGAVRGGVADGRPSLERVEQACEAILALSGTTQRPARGRGVPLAGARAPACELADLAGPRDGRSDHASPTRRCSRGR